MKFKASIYNYIFGMANIGFAIISGILLVPLYLAYIDTSTYGSWLALSNVILIIGSVESGFGLVITQYLSKAIQDKNRNSISDLNGSNVILSILISLLLIVIGCGLSPFIVAWVNTPESSISIIKHATIVSVVSAVFGFLAGQIGVYTQVWQKTFHSGLSNLLSSMFGIGVIILLLYLDMGILSLAYGALLRSLFKFIYLFIYSVLQWKSENMPMFRFNNDLSKKMIVESFMPFLSRISSIIVNNSQVFMVSAFISPSMAAIYDITSKLIVICSLLMSNLNGSIFASLAHIFATNDKPYIKSSLESLFEITNSVYFWAFLFCTFFTKEVVTIWVGSPMFGGMILNILIIISIILKERKSLLQVLLFSIGTFSFSSRIDILASFIYISIIVLAIPYYGINVIPLAMIISSLIGIYFYDKMLLNILHLDVIWMYNIGRKLFIPFVTIGCMLLFFPPINNIYLSLVLKGLVFLSLVILSQWYFSDVTRKIITERLFNRT